MKKYQRITALLLSLALALAVTSALAASSGERVFDNANLFTAAEEQELRDAIAAFQQATNMDFVVLTGIL